MRSASRRFSFEMQIWYLVLKLRIPKSRNPIFYRSKWEPLKLRNSMCRRFPLAPNFFICFTRCSLSLLILRDFTSSTFDPSWAWLRVEHCHETQFWTTSEEYTKTQKRFFLRGNCHSHNNFVLNPNPGTCVVWLRSTKHGPWAKKMGTMASKKGQICRTKSTEKGGNCQGRIQKRKTHPFSISIEPSLAIKRNIGDVCAWWIRIQSGGGDFG